MGNTQSGKLVKEVVTDARALLKANSKDTLDQLVRRRQVVERDLLEVTKHKEELLQKRAAGIRNIVNNYQEKRTQMLDQFSAAATTASVGGASEEEEGEAFAAAAAALAKGNTARSAAGGGGLPSPAEVLKRMEEKKQQQQSESSSDKA